MTPVRLFAAFEWSAEKRRFFRFDNGTVVSAAAGSGKTTALVELYLRLLEGLPPEEDGPGGLGPGGRLLEPEEIVVVTFTEKAAQDLTRKVREGLLARLDQAQALPDPAARRTLSARWEEARARLEVAPIGTVHHYAARLLREHPVEAGVDPGFDVLDEADADALRREAAAAVVRDALEQRDAALVLLLQHLPLADQGEYPGIESSLVAALSRMRGAGTSVEDLRRANPARLAELETDRVRLAADIEAAATALRGVPVAQPFLTAWDALPDAARRVAPDLDDTAWQPLLALPPLAKNWRGPGSRHPMRQTLAEALDALPLIFWQRDATPLGEAFLDLLARVEAAYGTLKRRRRALDFDDLEEGAVRLLQRDLAAGGTLLASRPAVVLVDEFQDNNRRQLELVRLLAGDGIGRLRDRALAIVGDPKQSIYRFRGADVSVFRRITDLVAGDTGPLRFAENFRSTPGIITFVNALFGRYMGPSDPGRPPYEVPFGPEDALVARRRGATGASVERAAGAAVEGGLGAAAGAAGAAVGNGAGAAVEVISLPANEPAEIRKTREMQAAVRRIQQLLAEGVRPGQIAVLLRTLAHAPPLQRGLEAAGVPAYVVKGYGFYGASEVRDVLCLLATLDCPLDDLSLAAVLRSPFAGISDDALLLLARPDPAARPRSLHSAFRRGRLAPPVPPLPEADRVRLAAFAAWHHELRGRKDRTPLPELVEEALDRSGYVAACLTRAGGDQQLANLRKLVEQARAFEARPGRTLRDFARELERAVSEEPRETAAQVVGETEDVVRIMTIHAAKGLEFPVVVVPGCADQMPGDRGPVVLDEDPDAGGLALRPVDPATLESMPTWLVRRLGEARRQKAKAEWRRLFYVAATRARDRLILIGEHPVKKDGSPSEVDTWRREVDALLAGRPELEATGVLRRLRWEELGETISEAQDAVAERPGQAQPAAPAAVAAAAVDQIVRRLQWRPTLPTRFAHTATELAEFATCPHRFYLTRRLGLSDGGAPWFDRGDEPAGGEAQEAASEREGEAAAAAGLRPLNRGSLAHAVLEHTPLGLDGARLASCIRELVREYAAMVPGGAPEAEQDDLAARITAFLDGPTGRALTRAWRVDQSRVLREYPFAMRLADGGATLVVYGKIDVLWQDDGGALHLIDYKTARGKGSAAALKYEFQLLTYALAAGRLAGAPVSRAGVVFLLDEPADPVWIDAGPERLAAFEARAVALARRIVGLEQDARDGEAWPRIALPECRRLECGFIPRCYGARRGDAPWAAGTLSKRG